MAVCVLVDAWEKPGLFENKSAFTDTVLRMVLKCGKVGREKTDHVEGIRKWERREMNGEQMLDSAVPVLLLSGPVF